MSKYDFNTWPRRTLCEVFQEMRDLYKTGYNKPMPGLIEEAQILANRMEACMDTSKDYFQIRDMIRDAKTELNQLKNELNLLNEIKEHKK